MTDTKDEIADYIGAVRKRNQAHWLLSMGGFFGATMSVLLNQSFWWGVLHFFCGWYYVLYAFTVRHESAVAGIRRIFDFFK